MLIWIYNLIQPYSTASRYVYSFVSYLYLQPRIYIYVYIIYIHKFCKPLWLPAHGCVFFSKPVTSPTLPHYTAAIIGWGSCWGCWRRLGNWTTRRMFCLSRFKGQTCRQNEGLQVLFLIDFKQQKYVFYFLYIPYICGRFTHLTFGEMLIWLSFVCCCPFTRIWGSFWEAPRFFLDCQTWRSRWILHRYMFQLFLFSRIYRYR